MLRKTGPGEIETIEDAGATLRAKLINFDFDGADLKHEHANWLNSHVIPLLSKPQYAIWMRGTASKKGQHGYNMLLSKRRVKTVEQYLFEKGIPDYKIQANWAGEYLSVSKQLDDKHDRAVEILMQAMSPIPPVPPPVPPPAPPTTQHFKLRMLGGGQVGGAINIGKALARLLKVLKLRKIPKIGIAIDGLFFEIRDTKNGVSAFYLYVAVGVGAGVYKISTNHKGPWNYFSTNKSIMATDFDGRARLTSLGALKWAITYINLIGVPPGVKEVYERIETGLSAGAGISTTYGYLIYLDSARKSP